MRMVLIPTDFTVESLQLIEYAVLIYPDSRLNIKLVAGYRMPTTYWGISQFNKEAQVHKQSTDCFREAKRRIALNHKDNIKELSIEFFTGKNCFAFQNFLDQFDAKDAIVPKENVLVCPNSKWFDTTDFIQKNVKNVIEVSIQTPKEIAVNKFTLKSLFNF